jgi:hypothetical protein
MKGGATAEGGQESRKHCCEKAIGQESTEQGQLSLYQSDRSFREPQLRSSCRRCSGSQDPKSGVPEIFIPVSPILCP